MDELLSGQRRVELHAGLEGTQFQALSFPSKGTFQELECPSRHPCSAVALHH